MKSPNKKRTLTLAGKVILSTTIIALLITTIYFQRQNIANANRNLEQIQNLRKEVQETSRKTRKVLQEFGIEIEEVDP